MNHVFEVQGLSKTYQHRARGNGQETTKRSTIDALKDVSFALDRGDILGVVGRNGAGKSTLLKTLAGIVKPSAGQVAYRGKLVSILELGAGFHPDLTGRENVFLNGELLGLSKADIRRRFPEILEFSELEEFIDEPVKHYSDGMYLRLAFSVFANLETNILLLDEIISVGDVAFRQKSYSKIIELANSGTTIIIVSHNPDQIKDMCNKCLWLDRGRNMIFGKTAEVLNNYLEKYLLAETVTLKDAVVDGDSIYWPDGLNIQAELNIRRFSLKAGMKSASEPRDTSDPLEIAIEFEKLNDTENLEITFTILSLYGTWVLADSYGRYEKFHDHVKQKGKYRCVCTIPAGVINFGIYQLGFLVSKDEVLIYQNPCLTNFKIDFREEAGVKNHLAKQAASLIKPLGSWQICRL
jgi:ABC-type polysaccharide/polyol phosphate transport system ATPase subunit